MTLMQMAVSTGAYQCFGVRCRIVALRLRADDPAPRESGASSGGSRARRETSTRLWPVTSPQACFVLKSGHAARGIVELREMFRATFSYKPDLKLDARKIISAGDDLVLVVVEWKSKTVSSSGEA